MILDALLIFDKDSAKTASGSSTNAIDFESARDIGTGEVLYVGIALSEALAGSDVDVFIETDDSDAFGSPTETQKIGSFADGDAEGKVIYAKLDPGKIDEQFVRLKYVFSGTATSGIYTAFITKDIDKKKDYPISYTIS